MRATLKNNATFMSHEKAEELAKTLNETEDACGWTYAAEKKGEKYSKVAIYDEENEFVDYL